MVDLVSQNQITVLFKRLDTESKISVLLSLANNIPDTYRGIEIDAEVGTALDAIGDLYRIASGCADLARDRSDPAGTRSDQVYDELKHREDGE